MLCIQQSGKLLARSDGFQWGFQASYFFFLQNVFLKNLFTKNLNTKNLNMLGLLQIFIFQWLHRFFWLFFFVSFKAIGAPVSPHTPILFFPAAAAESSLPNQFSTEFERTFTFQFPDFRFFNPADRIIIRIFGSGEDFLFLIEKQFTNFLENRAENKNLSRLSYEYTVFININCSVLIINF